MLLMCCAAHNTGKDKRLDYGSKMITLHNDGPVARFLSKDIRRETDSSIQSFNELNAWLDIMPTKSTWHESQCQRLARIYKQDQVENTGDLPARNLQQGPMLAPLWVHVGDFSDRTYRG